MALVGCGGEASVDEGGTSGGDGVPSTVSLSPELSIGGEGAVGEAEFGEVLDIQLGSGGEVYVLDGMRDAVQLFSPEGQYLRTFGGSGSGPGEIDRAVAIVWGPNGRLWVIDPGNGRFTAFDVGTGASSSYRTEGGGPVHPWTGTITDDGVLWDVGFDFGADGPAAVFGAAAIEPDGLRALDRITLPPANVDIYEARSPGIAVIIPVPFSAMPLDRVGPDGSLWLAHSGSPFIRRRVDAGDGGTVLGRDFDPLPITAEDVQRRFEEEDMANFVAQFGQEIAGGLRERLPEHQPYIFGFFFGDEGRTWIMKNDDAAPPGGFSADVYDAAGALVAALPVPLSHTPWPRVRDGKLIGVTRDELGIETVEVFRIVGMDGGSE